MAEKLSFKEYCLSKEYLRLAAESIPQITEQYELTKYCKFPVVTDDEDKQYVSFKPKDTVEVVWEIMDPAAPVARSVVVVTEDDDGAKVQPAWGNTKLASWLKNNTKKAK